MKHLIILRPVKSGQDNLRLGLYTEDFRKFVSTNVAKLCIDFGDGEYDVPYLTTYINHGSIVDIEQINGWLASKGYTNAEQRLLFELEISADGRTHIYHYLGLIVK